MELFTWITDFIEFFGFFSLVIFYGIYRLSTKVFRGIDLSSPDGRIRFNRSSPNYRPNRNYQANGYYQSNGNGYNRNSMFHSDDDNQYSHSQHEEDNSSRQYDGPYGTGDYVMNGSYDEELDFSNPNHYPIIDSYDNNIDENNPTQPW